MSGAGPGCSTYAGFGDEYFVGNVMNDTPWLHASVCRGGGLCHVLEPAFCICGSEGLFRISDTALPGVPHDAESTSETVLQAHAERLIRLKPSVSDMPP